MFLPSSFSYTVVCGSLFPYNFSHLMSGRHTDTHIFRKWQMNFVFTRPLSNRILYRRSWNYISFMKVVKKNIPIGFVSQFTYFVPEKECQKYVRQVYIQVGIMHISCFKKQCEIIYSRKCIIKSSYRFLKIQKYFMHVRYNLHLMGVK